MNEVWSISVMMLTGKTKALGEKRTVPVLLCPPQSSLHAVASLPLKRINTNLPVFQLLKEKKFLYTLTKIMLIIVNTRHFTTMFYNYISV
jgi:hypothetical protein